MAPAIPDRWTQYKPVGEKIQGTRFIAFKVPLSSNANEKVKTPTRLDADMLLKIVPKLGLIIDLTNTDRYYDPKYFLSRGIEYEKLKIPGHVTPPEYLVKMFKRHVRKYLHENEHNDKLIGVHCTHGVNRTGFFICNYMITEMTMNPDEAMQKFSKARGHSIERPNYLAALLGLGQKNPALNGIQRKGDHSNNQVPENSSKPRPISSSSVKVKFEQRRNPRPTYKHPKKDYKNSRREATRSLKRNRTILKRPRSRESRYHMESHGKFHHIEGVRNWRDRSHNETFTHHHNTTHQEPESTRHQKTANRNLNTNHKNPFRHQSSSSKYSWKRTTSNEYK